MLGPPSGPSATNDAPAAPRLARSAVLSRPPSRVSIWRAPPHAIAVGGGRAPVQQRDAIDQVVADAGRVKDVAENPYGQQQEGREGHQNVEAELSGLPGAGGPVEGEDRLPCAGPEPPQRLGQLRSPGLQL